MPKYPHVTSKQDHGGIKKNLSVMKCSVHYLVMATTCKQKLSNFYYSADCSWPLPSLIVTGYWLLKSHQKQASSEERYQSGFELIFRISYIENDENQCIMEYKQKALWPPTSSVPTGSTKRRSSLVSFLRACPSFGPTTKLKRQRRRRLVRRLRPSQILESNNDPPSSSHSACRSVGATNRFQLPTP